MSRVVLCLTTQHDLVLVALAAALCFVASLSAVSLLHRARASAGRARLAWIGAAGCATGCGIWATHFVAMLAFTPGFTVTYGVVLSAVSLGAAILVTTGGFAFAMYMPTRWNAPLGGALVGAGVGTMHYLGMAATTVPGYLTYSADLVAASVGFGMALAAAATTLALHGRHSRATLGAAGLLTLAVVALHFTGMGAVGVVTTNLDFAHPQFAMSPKVLALAVISIAAAVLGISLAGAVADRKVKDQGRRLLIAVNNMPQGLVMFDAHERMVICNERYREMYRLPAGLQPGCSLREVIAARIESGSLKADLEIYRDKLLKAMVERRTLSWVVETPDGRAIAVTNTPTASGDWVATHEDITERSRAKRELERTKSFLDTVIENIPVTITVKELPDYRYVLINRAGEKYFGVPREQMLGKTTRDVFPTGTAQTVIANEQAAVRAGHELSYDVHPVTTPGGDSRLVSAKLLPVVGDDREPRYLVSVVEDVTERKRVEARIAYMARHDPLTDLPNRAAFMTTLESALEQARAATENVALLSVDLDRFKEINDVCGHATGDAALTLFARRLQEAAGGAFAARIGGDEFCIILADGEQPGSAEQLAARLQALAAEPIDVDGELVRMGLSVGIAIFPVDCGDTTSLIANADAALQRAKAEGRGMIRFFDPRMDARLRDRRSMLTELRQGLDRGELSLHYQPQSRVDGTVIGFEALMRWSHPTRGMIPPAMFIPVAEEGGLIVAMGEWALREACREAASWPQKLRVAVNLSPIQFKQSDLPAFVHEVLLATGLRPDRLELEITEGVLIDDFSRAVAILRRLKALGVRIAMDDFGTGYSSLSYLQAFPFDKIKIDRAFIANLDVRPQSAAIVRAVIGLGRGLNLPVIAEGVETAAQLEFLAREACDEVQGYLLGRPAPIDSFAGIIGRAPAAPVAPAAPARAALA